MQLGMIGLGCMGANRARRLMKGGHECVVYAASAKAVKEFAHHGGIGTDSSGVLVSQSRTLVFE
jgi:6-phosphogluconate dehydrogenase